MAYIETAKHLRYDVESGALFWKRRSDRDAAWNAKHVGKEAGGKSSNGYLFVQVLIGDRRFSLGAHTIAWVISRGNVPEHEIDHINGERADNRPENLRDVPRAINNKNLRKPSNNTSGVSGVYWNKAANRWQAYCRVDRRIRYIGIFSSIDDAAAAVRSMRAKHGYTERHGT